MWIFDVSICHEHACEIPCTPFRARNKGRSLQQDRWNQRLSYYCVHYCRDRFGSMCLNSFDVRRVEYSCPSCSRTKLPLLKLQKVECSTWWEDQCRRKVLNCEKYINRIVETYFLTIYYDLTFEILVFVQYYMKFLRPLRHGIMQFY